MSDTVEQIVMILAALLAVLTWDVVLLLLGTPSPIVTGSSVFLALTLGDLIREANYPWYVGN